MPLPYAAGLALAARPRRVRRVPVDELRQRPARAPLVHGLVHGPAPTSAPTAASSQPRRRPGRVRRRRPAGPWPWPSRARRSRRRPPPSTSTSARSSPWSSPATTTTSCTSTASTSRRTLKAGQPTTVTLTGKEPGTYEVETHHPGAAAAQDRRSGDPGRGPRAALAGPRRRVARGPAAAVHAAAHRRAVSPWSSRSSRWARCGSEPRLRARGRPAAADPGSPLALDSRGGPRRCSCSLSLVITGWTLLALVARPRRREQPGAVRRLRVALGRARLLLDGVRRHLAAASTRCAGCAAGCSALRPHRGRTSRSPSTGSGYWPAAAGLLAFAWLELVAPDNADLLDAAHRDRRLPRWSAWCWPSPSAPPTCAAATPSPRGPRSTARLSPLGRRADGRWVLRTPLHGPLQLDAPPGPARGRPR